MKKILITFILILSLLVSSFGYASNKNVYSKFNDLKEGMWYSDTMVRLVELGGIAGFPDGSIRPNGTITKGEFIKMMLATLGHEEGEKSGNNWASGWRDKAVELNVITEDYKELAGFYTDDDLNKHITRVEMAELLSNYFFNTKSVELNGEHYLKYKDNIKDVGSIEESKQYYVLTSYHVGLIGGDNEGNFMPNKTLTRAEASAVIVRLYDPVMRLNTELAVENIVATNPDKSEEVTKPIKKEVIGPEDVIDAEIIKKDGKTYVEKKIKRGEEIVTYTMEFDGDENIEIIKDENGIIRVVSLPPKPEEVAPNDNFIKVFHDKYKDNSLMSYGSVFYGFHKKPTTNKGDEHTFLLANPGVSDINPNYSHLLAINTKDIVVAKKEIIEVLTHYFPTKGEDFYNMILEKVNNNGKLDISGVEDGNKFDLVYFDKFALLTFTVK